MNGTAAQFDDWGKRHAQCLFEDPDARAEWYAEKRVVFLEGKIDACKKKLAQLESELAAAKQEWAAIEAGEAKAEVKDDTLDQYATELKRTYQGENASSLDSEKSLLEEILERTRFADHGWRVSETKANDWLEYIILTRCRVTPRPRNNAKGILKALHAGVEAHKLAKSSGETPQRCSEVGYSRYLEVISDNGTYGSIRTLPILEAFEAAKQERLKASAEGVPLDQLRQRVADTFNAVVERVQAQQATGPPN